MSDRVFHMSSSFLCFLAKRTQEMELITSHCMHNAHSQSKYQLPVEESLACGSLSEKQVVSVISPGCAV